MTEADGTGKRRENGAGEGNRSETSVTATLRRAKQDSFRMATLPETVRNAALRGIADALRRDEKAIFAANEADLAAGAANDLPAPLMKRLKFDAAKLAEAMEEIAGLIALPDPLFRTLLAREIDAGLVLKQVTCPIGVIGVIFESRPDALVQIACLCLKSGNAAVLKGGSEAANTNKALFETIRGAGLAAGAPEGFLSLIETRADVDEMLDRHDLTDLLIPRGSNAFVRRIMSRSSIPVMGHADGLCHVYVDKAADAAKALTVIRDAKTQYVAVCNATESLLVHRDIAADFLPQLQRDLDANGVCVRACAESLRFMPGAEPAAEEDFKTEYLDYILSVKVVDDLEAAVARINAYGSHHTDCIVTEDAAAAERFMSAVDSAGVYLNCSTRFADGFRYGFGAEVGVSTGKLHARGPVGLDGLVTYKYRLYGDGHIVADYAEGRKRFRFRDL